MKKYLIAAAVTMFAASSHAAVDCSGVPEVLKMGDFGSQERYVIVDLGGRDYRLGDAADHRTKARLALAQTALLAGRKLTLRFYGHNSCSSAGDARALPSSTQIVN